MTQPPLPSLRHIREFDGIRGLAVLMVIGYHAGIEPPGMSPGRAGVILFFVLSGFLISGILIDRRGTEHYYKNFWGRRVVRIFPLYYAVLALLFLILPHVAPDRLLAYHDVVTEQGWYWLYLQNVKFSIDGFPDFAFMGHLWSLAVEEQFYLIWPFVVALAAPRSLRRICWGLVVVGYVSRFVHLALGLGWPWSYTMLWSSVDSLAAGALIAIALRADRLSPQLAKPVALAIIGLFVAGTGLLVVLQTVVSLPITSHLSIIIERSFTTPISAGVVILVLVLRDSHWLPRFLRLRFLLLCGKHSYAMYILHTYVVLVVDTALARLYVHVPVPSLLHVPLLAICAVTATLAASVISWYLLEKPCLSLKRYFAYAAPRASGSETERR